MRHAPCLAMVLVFAVACGDNAGDARSTGKSGATGNAGTGSAAAGHGAGGSAAAGRGASGSGATASGGTMPGGAGRAADGGTTSGSGGARAGATANGGMKANGGASAGVNAGGAAQGGMGTAGGGQGPTAGDGGSDDPTGDPAVRIVGRTETGTKGPRFSWPGTSFAARFSGTQATIQLDDAANKNEFEVIVDGAKAGTLVTQAGKTDYPLATGLTDGNHDVLVWRRTEAYYNPTEFLGITGFSTGGALLAPSAPHAHRIEAIGDSITVGYGNEGMPGCTSDTTNQNNYLAYASVAARSLDADLVTIAWSGIGMYRNYNETGPSADAMPARYDRAVPTEDTSTWDFSTFSPEVVTINLGTNDYSTMGDPGMPFVTAYVGFLQHLRSKYPAATIVCLIQQSGSDVNIKQAIATFESGGGDNVESFDINVSAGGSGCDGHPDVAKDQAMGDKLATELKRLMSW